MKDVNKILRTKIYELLAPVAGCPVYYKYVPNTDTSDVYMVISTVNNSNVSTMQTSDTDTVIQVSIFSRETISNAGNVADDKAEIVYNTLYPNTTFTLDLSPNFQNTSVRMTNDISPDALSTGNYIFINRFIQFRFNIYQI